MKSSFLVVVVVLYANYSTGFTITGAKDAEYIAVGMDDESPDCFFQVAVQDCRKAIKLSVAYPDSEEKSQIITASGNKACLSTKCTTLNGKLQLTNKVEIVAEDGVEVKVDILDEGISDNIYADRSKCMSGSPVSTATCTNKKQDDMDVDTGKPRVLQEEIDDGRIDSTQVLDYEPLTRDGATSIEKWFNDNKDNEDVNAQELITGQEKSAKIQFNNWFHGCLNVQCPNQHGFFSVISGHVNAYQDRLWTFYCKRVTNVNFDRCYWTGYQNGLDLPLFAQCGANYILSGIYSQYNKNARDRQFSLKCCHAPHFYAKHCYLSNYINGWDGWMHYALGGARVFTGLFSYHDNGKEDRIWKVASCDYVR